MALGFVLDTISSIVKRVSSKDSDNSDLHSAAKNAVHALSTNSLKNSSIRARASQNIAYYPLVASSNISFDTIVILSKYLERSIAEMIKIIIANQEVIDLDRGTDKRQVIASFQGMTIGTFDQKDFDPRNASVSDLAAEVGKDIVNRNLDRELRRSGSGRMAVREDHPITVEILNNSGEILQEALVPFNSGLTMTSLNEMSSLLVSRISKEMKARGLAESVELLNENDKINTSSSVVVTNDRANDLTPTVIELDIVYKSGNGFEKAKLVMAVKTVVHTVETTGMIDEIGRSVSTKKFAFPLIQWLTGEISFVKDLVLNLKETKTRVTAGAKDKGIRFLNRLRLMNSQNRLSMATKGNRLLPTTTIVLTVDEVDEIRNKYSINLRSTNEADKFVELFGLMNFIIVDESTNAMHIYDEVRSQFDSTSLPKEARENKEQGNVIKALVAAMGVR